MRNHVQYPLRVGLAVTCLTWVLLEAGATAAHAATDEPAIQSHVPVTFGGSVATVAILLGVLGMIAGLWRHRRRVTRQARTIARQVPQIAPTTSELTMQAPEVSVARASTKV
ncbi:MAG: hypothetical protein JOZ47_02180 [Kutzneria sp.]|nr:hypothetical protein [Kutzneria sp.]